MKKLTPLIVLLLSGCTHIPPGGAAELHFKFGVPSIFQVTKDNTGIVVTNDTIKTADSQTKLQILLFEWSSSGKDIIITNPKAP